jgi:hypothetical protein
MLEYDSETAIKLYLHYLNHKITKKEIVLQDWDIDVKTIKKAFPLLAQIYELRNIIIKSLKTEKQQQAFKDILIKYIADNNINKALNSVPDIYRKKIRIDNNQIAKIQQQHAESVSLLNEYMKDESENNTIDSTNIKTGKTTHETSTAEICSESLPDAGDIVFSKIQLSALSIFTKNNLCVSQSDMETFARSKGVLKNQLIESLNELCYDCLDDVLIEENEDGYIINSDYYQTIFAK